MVPVPVCLSLLSVFVYWPSLLSWNRGSRQPLPLDSCAFLLDQFQDFGSRRRNFSKERHDTGHLPSLFSGPQPATASQQLLQRAEGAGACSGGQRHYRETCACVRGSRELTACSWKTARMCNRESLIVAGEVNKIFFSGILAVKDTLCPRAVLPLFSFLRQVLLHCGNTQGVSC